MPSGNAARGYGFAYVVLLIALAVMSLVAAAAVQAGAVIARRDAERHLLAIGVEFELALRSYAQIAVPQAGAPGMAAPRTLGELLKDPRVPGLRRHLRQVYADPLTGSNEWGLVEDPAGGIVGIYSLAEGKPIQRAGFEPHRAHFEEAESYRQWVFGLPPPPGGVPAR